MQHKIKYNLKGASETNRRIKMKIDNKTNKQS